MNIYKYILPALCFFAPSVYAAPSEPAPEPTEIVIQGAPRKLTLFDLPGSATVIGSSVLKQRSSSNISEIIDTIPGLNFSGGSARPRFFQIRGIGELEQYEGAPNPSVGVIIDDIDFSGLGVVTSLYDIDQIEVLRGPQGTRFGSSALAGVINVRSTRPTQQLSGNIEVGIGNDQRNTTGVAVSGAVPGTNNHLLLRISNATLRADGFRDNRFLSRDDTNGRDERTTRLTLETGASSDFSVVVTALNLENGNRYDAFSVDNGFTTYSDRPGNDAIRANAGSIRAELKLDDARKIESITSVLDSIQRYSFDGDWGNNQYWEPYAPYDYFSATTRERRTLSQELHLRSESTTHTHGENYRWVTGVFFQRLDEDSTLDEFSDNIRYRDLTTDYRAETAAGFGEIEIPLLRGTSLSVGLRGESRSMDYNDSRPAQFSPHNNMLGGSLSISHDLDRSIRAYITAARGFKGGGFNAGTRVPDEARIYTPEYLWNFEGGVKGTFLAQKLQGEIAVFHGEREDAQLKFAFQNDPNDPLAFTYITRSAAEGYSRGIEARASLQTTPFLRVFSSGTLTDTSYTSVPDETPTLLNRDHSHAPNWSYNLGAHVDFSSNWFGRIELSGKDAFYYDDSNNQRSTPYHLLHASFGYRDSTWSWTVWGRNLLNEKYAVRGFFFGNEPPDFAAKEYVQRGDPLTFGTSVTWFF